jgi:twitching motility protein PilU
MKTFDKALFDLYEAGKITEEDALKNADSANNLRLRIKLARENGSMTSTGGFTMEGVEEDEPTVFEPRSSD